MKMLKTLAGAAFAAALLWPSLALAQTNPHLTQGQVLTPAQWNNLFAGKQDTLGFTPMDVAGGTFTGRIVTAPPGASTAGFNLTPGTAPGSPANGDLWTTTSSIFARVNGVTYDLIGAPCANCALTNAANTFTAGPQTITTPANTLTQGLNLVHSSPTSGNFLGPWSWNLITVTDGGFALHDNGSGNPLDSYGVSQVLSSALRINAIYSGDEPPIRIVGSFVSKYVGAASSTAETVGTFGSGYTNTQIGAIWGGIGQASLGPAGIAGALIGLTGEVGAESGSTLNKRMGLFAVGHAPVQGSALDAGIVMAQQLDNRGIPAGFKNAITIANAFFPSNNYPALDPTGNFLNFDSATTLANIIDGHNVIVTGNILSFPNLVATGAGALGLGGATPGSNMLAVNGAVQFTSATVTINGVANPALRISGNTDGATNATVFQIANSTAAVQLVSLANEPSRTTVRWGLTIGNWAEIADFGSASTNGLIIGEFQNKPVVLGTNNAERARIAGSGCFSVGTTVDCGAPGIVNVLTGFRQGTMTAGRVLRSDGNNFISAQLACADLTVACITGNQSITVTGDVTGSGTTAIATTLASVATAGTTGSSTAIPVITIDVKGRTTSITTAAVVAPANTLSGTTLAAGVTASSLTSLGTITTLTATTINAFTAGGAIAMGGNNITGGGTATFTTFVGALTGHASSDLALTGGTMSGAIAMGTNAVTGLTTLAGAGALTFQSNGSTFAGLITTGQQWVIGNNTTAPISGVALTLNQNTIATIPTTGTTGVMLDIIPVDGVGARISLRSYAAGAFNQPTLNFYHARGTALSPTATQSGDIMWGSQGYGYATSGGAGYLTNAGAGMLAVAMENFTSTAAGEKLVIQATATGANSSTNVAHFFGSGGVSVFNTTDAGAGNILLNGILKYAAAPTAVSGAGPILIGSGSTINSRMKVNLSGTDYWVPVSTTAF